MNEVKLTDKSCEGMEKTLIWFVLGPIGAGKSSYINKLLTNHDITYLSSDLLKKEKGGSYLESREEMGKIMQQHIKNRIPFITEGTGQHDDMYDLFLSLKNDPEIDLKVTYIDVDLEVALLRNKSRHRVLPDDTVREVYNRSKERRDLWKDFACEYINYKELLIPGKDFNNIY